MKLKILLPFKVFCSEGKVSKIIAETSGGSFGILPKRRDCVAALVPGILAFQGDNGQENYVAIDQGVLVKTGYEVVISVRNAIRGHNLTELQETVEKDFMNLSEQEKNTRDIMTKMENGLIRRFVEFRNE